MSEKKGGDKHDNGKASLVYISPELEILVSRVRELGVQKYGSYDNWRLGHNISRNLSALYRHSLLFKIGENCDDESGLPHPAHIVCCSEHILNDLINHPENDDRNKLPKEQIQQIKEWLYKKEAAQEFFRKM